MGRSLAAAARNKTSRPRSGTLDARLQSRESSPVASFARTFAVPLSCRCKCIQSPNVASHKNKSPVRNPIPQSYLPAAYSLVAQANSCANPSQPPECPASSNYFLYATQENLRCLAERNQAAILARIVDCPKPEFVEYACAPKKKGCNSKGKNHTRTKEQSSQKDAL